MRRPIVYGLLAVMAAALAAMVVFSTLRKREAEVQNAIAHTADIVVAAHDLPIGTKLDAAALKTARWSRDAVPPGAYTDTQALAGAFVKSGFVANEPIVASKLFTGQMAGGVMPLLIPPGMRAMSVQVDEVADIAGFVQPHTRVDILVAISQGTDQQSFSRIVLQNVEVLAVAQEIEQTEDKPTVVKVVTLLVTPADAEKLGLASHEGSLKLAMRNYSDNKVVSTSGANIKDLLRTGGAASMPLMQAQAQPMAAHRTVALLPPGPRPLTVEIMRDGNSSESISFVRSGSAGQVTRAPGPIGSRATAPAPANPDPDSNPISSNMIARYATGPGTSAPVGSASPIAPSAEHSATAPPVSSSVLSMPQPSSAPQPPGSSIEPSAPRPGEPGYQPAPKTVAIPLN
jgi:pilus assembly protein CpaB